MQDKRCRYKMREKQAFYLFIKHRAIYYAYFPEYRKTLSTHETNFRKAYEEAWNLYGIIKEPEVRQLFKPFNDKKRDRDLRFVISYLPDNIQVLTESTIKNLQNALLERGISGKSVNNYVYVLRRAYTGKFPTFTNLEYKSQYRSCFPVREFYGFYSKCSTRLHYLAFFAMTTGCRLSEIYKCEKIEKYGRLYLQINGTKTVNAKRIIPVLPETIDCLEYLMAGFRTSAYKESVIEAGKLCGFDEDYIQENHIVFHSWRKLYKTLLESCNINNSWIEYYMGHSQTNTVNQLYFVGSSADDTEVYPKVIEALKRFL